MVPKYKLVILVSASNCVYTFSAYADAKFMGQEHKYQEDKFVFSYQLKGCYVDL